MSLVLVLAMVFSFASTAFAVDTGYNDDAKIQNKTAVAVMSGMGIINGKDGNNFAPTDTFKRSEAAKIMTYMLLGPDAAEALPVTKDPFPDVSAKDHWFASYVAYVTEEKLVGGWGGEFHPEDELGREEWLKMLLGVIGYDTTDLEGTNWDTKTVARAQQAGIVTANELKLEFNRDTAVLYAWNALWAPLAGVNPTYVVTYTDNNNEKTQTFGAWIDALTFANKNQGVVATKGTTLGGKIFNLTDTRTTDTFGRPQTTYKYNSNDKRTDIVDEPVATFYAAVNNQDIGKELGIKDFATSDVTTWTYDGNKTATASGNYGGQGCVLEVYANPVAPGARPTFSLVQIDTYVYKITSTDLPGKNDPDPVIKVQSGRNNEQFTIPNDYAKDDIVSFIVGKDAKDPTKGAAYEVTKLTATPGKVSAKKGTEYIRIDDGAAVKFNYFAKGTGIAGLNVSSTTVYDFYFDNYGNILYADTHRNPPVMPEGYVFPVEVQFRNTTVPGNLFDEAVTEQVAAKAKVITTAGTVEVLDLAVVQDFGTKRWYLADNTGVANNSFELTSTTNNTGYIGTWSDNNGFTVETIYAVNTVNGKSVLTVPNEGVDSNLTIMKDQMVIKTGYHATSATETTVVKYAENPPRSGEYSASATTYKGYTSFPKNGDTLDKVLVLKAREGTSVEKIIAFDTDAPAGTVSYGIYLEQGETKIVNGNSVDTYNFMVDGAVVSVMVAQNSTVQGSALTPDRAYKLTSGMPGEYQIENLIYENKAFGHDSEQSSEINLYVSSIDPEDLYMTLRTDTATEDYEYGLVEGYDVYNVENRGGKNEYSIAAEVLKNNDGVKVYYDTVDNKVVVAVIIKTGTEYTPAPPAGN